MNGGRVVDTEDIDRLDLKVGGFELDVRFRPPMFIRSAVAYLADDPSEWKRGIGTGENVLVHAIHQP